MRIAQDTSACAEMGLLFSKFWCTKDDPLFKFSKARHISGNVFHGPQTSTIFLSQTVIKSVLWLI
jgi:hypothetical protein